LFGFFHAIHRFVFCGLFAIVVPTDGLTSAGIAEHLTVLPQKKRRSEKKCPARRLAARTRQITPLAVGGGISATIGCANMRTLKNKTRVVL
jgi:hypothetical protein